MAERACRDGVGQKIDSFKERLAEASEFGRRERCWSLIANRSHEAVAAVKSPLSHAGLMLRDVQ